HASRMSATDERVIPKIGQGVLATKDGLFVDNWPEPQTQNGICILRLTHSSHCNQHPDTCPKDMERELKAERTAACRAAAKACGRTGGRPRIDPDKLEHARILYLNSRKSAADVCQMVGIGRRKPRQNIVYLSAELNRLCWIRVSTDISIPG